MKPANVLNGEEKENNGPQKTQITQNWLVGFDCRSASIPCESLVGEVVDLQRKECEERQRRKDDLVWPSGGLACMILAVPLELALGNCILTSKPGFFGAFCVLGGLGVLIPTSFTTGKVLSRFYPAHRI